MFYVFFKYKIREFTTQTFACNIKIPISLQCSENEILQVQIDEQLEISDS